MKVTDTMIRPELRRTGKLIRALFHFKSPGTFVRLQKLLMRVKKQMKPRNMQFEERYIHTEENPNLRVCICKSFNLQPQAIGLLWVHGGGYALGIPEQDAAFMHRFVEAANCVVVSPDYTLSINAPYPAALNDCYGALLWMKEHAGELGIRDNQLFVGGESAGGGLTAAVTLLARDKGEVNIAYQMPFYPMIDDRMITPSSQNNDAPIWDSHANKVAWKMYLGNLYGTDAVPSYAAPARADDYKGLPPTYTYVGSIEPFRDETIQYVKRLKAAGVKAELDIYKGCFHAFDIAGANKPVGKKAEARYIQRFKYAAKHYFAAQTGSDKT